MRFYVASASTLIIDPAALPMIVQAVDRQLIDDAGPAWGHYGNVFFVESVSDIPKDAVPIVVYDDADQAGALGWHTEELGVFFGRIFVRPVLDNGGDLYSNPALSLSSVISHEVLETLIDPTVSDWSQRADGTLVASEVCLTGDTEIPLLDGTARTIESLSGEQSFWVYSCTPDGRIVPGKGHSARKTRENAEIVEVELDNGATVKCTADHPFMLRDGSYALAGSLGPGTSLMPLYRRKQKITGGNDYEQVLVPSTETWEFTHRITSDECPRGYVRHHVDFNRFNNEPTNLRVMRANEHIALHGNYAKHLWELGKHGWLKPASPEKKARDAARFAAYNKTQKHRDEVREVGRKAMRALWEKPGFREHHSARGRRIMDAYNASEAQAAAHARFLADPERRAAWRANIARSQNAPHLKKLHSETGKRVQGQRSPEYKSRLSQFAMHTRWHERGNRTSDKCEFCKIAASPLTNHKVVAVRKAGRSDVWDITVDVHNNFAVSAGVFVHNCDPVESDAYPIAVLDKPVMVSNFVLPAWFDAQASQGPFDKMGKLTAPFTMTPGGYLVTMVAGPSSEEGARQVGRQQARAAAGRSGKRRSSGRMTWT